LMGGELTFMSEDGIGSVFTVTIPLPAACPEHEPAAVAPAAEVAATRDVVALPRGQRVLVVEDNMVNQRITVGQLEALGYEVHVAADGLEAIGVAEEHHFDIVLMDCHMPRMDGFATTRALRREPWAITLPIVAVTASVLPEDVARCHEAGMNDVLTKPFTRAELEAVVSRWAGTRDDAGDVRPA